MNINIIIAVLVGMILCHLLADYPLQGWLAQAKAKSYWASSPKENKFDWVAALICHSTMWGIMIMIPLAVASNFMLNEVWIALPVNILLHFVIDHLKANKKWINLNVDQAGHLIQIIGTWGLWAQFCCGDKLIGLIAHISVWVIVGLKIIIEILYAVFKKQEKPEDPKNV